MKKYVNVKKKILKDLIGVMVVRTFCPGTWEEEAGTISGFKVSLVYRGGATIAVAIQKNKQTKQSS